MAESVHPGKPAYAVIAWLVVRKREKRGLKRKT